MVAELLELCGYEAQELESELPRVQKAFDKLGITCADVDKGKERITKYYDIELSSVRKLLGLYIRELVNLMLAREEGKTKIIYSRDLLEALPAIESASKNVKVAEPDVLFATVFGCIFDKLVPVLEAAEAQWLRAGVAHCGYVKMTAGLFLLNLIPKPDLQGSGFPCCDEGPKTHDLLHEFFGIPLYYVDYCQDREFKEYPETARLVDFVAKSMRKFAKRLEEVAGVEITDEMLWEILEMKRELALGILKLEDLIESSDPLPISATHPILWQKLIFAVLSINNLQRAIDAVDTLYQELRERVDRGVGVVEKGAPRILCILPPSYSDPRPEHLLGEVGIAVACAEAPLFQRYEKGIFGEETEEWREKDPYRTLAAGFSAACMTNSLRGRVSIIIEACKRAKVDGVLDRVYLGCRAIGAGDALMIRDAVKRELGIPVLLSEWDAFDPRAYNHERDKKRLEIFAMMMRSHKEMMKAKDS